VAVGWRGWRSPANTKRGEAAGEGTEAAAEDTTADVDDDG
jgi:hypothetical protein